MPETFFYPLDDGAPWWGKVALLPWDADTFGFPVAAWQPGDPKTIARDLEAFRRRLQAWASTHQVELVSCTVGADDRIWRALLSELGFLCVEQTLDLTFRVQGFSGPPPSRPVRLATAEDHSQIEDIAAHTFRHGRYHADPRFPPTLADRRYRFWVGHACTSTEPADRVYVVGKPGNVRGFFQLRLEGDRAAVGIMGVAESAKGSAAAVDLMTGMQLDLKALGVRWITAKISASNASVINLVAHFRYHFRNPRATFHWHAREAPHLLPRGFNPG